MFKNLLDGSSGLFGPRPFHSFKMSDFPNCEIMQNNMFESDFGFFLIFLKYPGVSKDPKINNISVGARGHVRKSLNHRNEGL